jgi:MarR family transcriptional repressor of emrRAB
VRRHAPSSSSPAATTTTCDRAARVSAGGAAALVALSAAGDLSVNELGCRVGLSQPAAVRMVDSLEVGGLAECHAGNAKAVPVRLTRDGARTVCELLAARGAPFAEAMPSSTMPSSRFPPSCSGKY